MNELKISDANTIVSNYRNAYTDRAQIVAAAVAVVAGIVYGIAITLFCTYMTYPTRITDCDYYINADGTTKHFSNPTFGGVLLYLFGGFIFPLLSAIPIGVGVYKLIDHYIIQKKTNEISQFILGFTDNYEAQSAFPLDQIKALFEKVDSTTRNELILRMNFNQLREARKTLPKRVFEKHLNTYNPDHRLWLEITKIYETIRTPEDLEKEIERWAPDKKKIIQGLFDLSKENPAFQKVLDKYKDLLNDNISAEDQLLVRIPTLKTWSELWHRAQTIDSERMKTKLRLYALEELKKAVKSQDHHLLQTISMVLVSNSTYEFDLTITAENALGVFFIGEYLSKHEKSDTVYKAAIEFISKNRESIFSHPFTLHSPAVYEILYPSRISERNCWSNPPSEDVYE